MAISSAFSIINLLVDRDHLALQEQLFNDD